MAPNYVGETVNPDESPLDSGDFRGVSPEYQNYANETDKPGDSDDGDTVTVVKTEEAQVTATGVKLGDDGPHVETVTVEVPVTDKDGNVETEEVTPTEAATTDAQSKDKDPADPANSSQPDASATTGPKAPASPASKK